MTLIAWLVVLELLVGFFLLIWLINKAIKQTKHSPAESALQQHLLELEAEKNKKQSMGKNEEISEGTNNSTKKRSKKK